MEVFEEHAEDCALIELPATPGSGLVKLTPEEKESLKAAERAAGIIPGPWWQQLDLRLEVWRLWSDANLN
jgi:hypothetical protein